MENKKLIIFDFDGVLVNTVDFWYKMHKDLNDYLTRDIFKDMSNGNYVETANKMKAEKNHIFPENADEKYHNELQNVFSIEDILHDTILGLSEKFFISIVSSSPSKVINDFIVKENLDGCILEIMGFEEHSSKIVKINKLLEKYNLKPNDAVFITDTIGDIKEANDCKVNTIAVTWGVHERERLEKGNPWRIIDNPEELKPAILEYFGEK